MVVGALLELLLPVWCAACRAPGPAVCDACRERLHPLAGPSCAGCGAPAPVALERCGDCRGPLDGARQALVYGDTCAALIAALKDGRRRDVAPALAHATAALLPPPPLGAVLVPVPGTPARVRRRGFDHAELIARALGRAWGRPVACVLRRDPRAAAQRGAARTRRIRQVRGQFRARPGAVAPAHAVLIDDVRTTGATLAACARSVHATCVARAVRAGPSEGPGGGAGGGRVRTPGSTHDKERPR